MAEIVTDEELMAMLKRSFGLKSANYEEDSDSDVSDLIDVDLQPEQIKEVRQAFKMFDRNNDGAISCDELGTVMRVLGMSPTGEELEELMKQADEDDDGEIDLDEFLRLMAGQFKETSTEKRMQEALAVMDPSRKGYVAADELYRVLTTKGDIMSADEAREFIQAVDKDNNGQIDCKEIMTMLLAK